LLKLRFVTKSKYGLGKRDTNTGIAAVTRNDQPVSDHIYSPKFFVPFTVFFWIQLHCMKQRFVCLMLTLLSSIKN